MQNSKKNRVANIKYWIIQFTFKIANTLFRSCARRYIYIPSVFCGIKLYIIHYIYLRQVLLFGLYVILNSKYWSSNYLLKIMYKKWNKKTMSAVLIDFRIWKAHNSKRATWTLPYPASKANSVLVVIKRTVGLKDPDLFSKLYMCLVKPIPEYCSLFRKMDNKKIIFTLCPFLNLNQHNLWFAVRNYKPYQFRWWGHH